VEDCIRMIEEPSGRPPVTWGQLSESQREVTEDWEEMQKYREKMGIHIH
jgi:dihydropyrimidine dehydrogenase (NAD+) subunit PreA